MILSYRLEQFRTKFSLREQRKRPVCRKHDTVNMRLQSHLMEPIIIHSLTLSLSMNIHKREFTATSNLVDDDSSECLCFDVACMKVLHGIAT